MTNVASAMHAAKAKAKRRAHLSPSIDFFAPAAKPRIAPVEETSSDARIRRRPSEAVMRELLDCDDRGRVGALARRRIGGQRAFAPPRLRASRYRASCSRFVQPFSALHQPLQLFLVHRMPALRCAV